MNGYLFKKEKTMAKSKFPQNQNFESNKGRSAFTKICEDMIKSEAWKDLSLRQHGLYLHLKSKYTFNPTKQTGNENNISIPTKEASRLYGDLRTFRDDMDALINHGFIRQVVAGVINKKVNIYGFSENWKKYGKENFKIPEEDKRYIPKRTKR